MLKVYLSHPVENIYTDEEHDAYVAKMKLLLKLLVSNIEFEIIDSRMDDFNCDEYRRYDVAILGETIKRMADADMIIFDEGWNGTYGCTIQHDIATKFHLPYIDLAVKA